MAAPALPATILTDADKTFLNGIKMTAAGMTRIADTLTKAGFTGDKYNAALGYMKARQDMECEFPHLAGMLGLKLGAVNMVFRSELPTAEQRELLKKASDRLAKAKKALEALEKAYKAK